MTKKDSADGVLGDIAAAGATLAWNIANFVLDGWGLTHAGVDQQGFGNLENGARLLYASTSGSVSNGGPAIPGVAITQSRRLPKENSNQIIEGGRQTDPRTNKRANFAKWTVSEAAAACGSEKKF